MVVLGVPQCLAEHGLSTFEVCDDAGSGSTIRGLSRGITANGVDAEKPILVLIHGYPQTYYMWRHVVKLLPSTARLFIPDIPGYGASSPARANDKATTGTAILEALATLLSVSNQSSAGGHPHRIILVGHDRGARICHRLTVDADKHAAAFNILATALIDIVPTTVQWAALADPAEAARSFHWPFLANAELASAMINAIGPEIFIQTMMKRWRGTGEAAIARFEADDAMEMYSRPFRQMESVVLSSCADYKAGAEQDVQEQRIDQEADRKIAVPVLVLHSRGMGERFDVREEWAGWVAQHRLLTVEQTGEGVGHFVPEEDPEATVGAMQRWLEDIGLQIA